MTSDQDRQSASDKIKDTAIRLRSPRSGASGPELALSTLTQGLTSGPARQWLDDADQEGALDPFLELLAVWLCAHRGDSSELLCVVSVPRHRDLPPGTLVDRVRKARQVALGPPPDLASMAAQAEE